MQLAQLAQLVTLRKIIERRLSDCLRKKDMAKNILLKAHENLNQKITHLQTVQAQQEEILNKLRLELIKNPIDNFHQMMIASQAAHRDHIISQANASIASAELHVAECQETYQSITNECKTLSSRLEKLTQISSSLEKAHMTQQRIAEETRQEENPMPNTRRSGL